MNEQDFIDRITFHRDQDIVEIDVSDVSFKGVRETDLFHDVLDRVISETGRTWYFISSFVNCTISPGAALQFSIRRAHAHDGLSRGAVRYGASDEVNRAMMSLGSNPKAAVNSFASREEAFAKINEMKAIAA